MALGAALGTTLGVDLSGGSGGGGGGGGSLALDVISVPATNAYSCYRKLRTAYAGYAFRVRRTPDNAEQDIPFAGSFVNITRLMDFVGSGSGYIKTLYDQSGNGRHLAQSTLAAQPRIVNAGVLETFLAGVPAMSFDGTDDRLFRSVANNTTGLTGNPSITVGVTCHWLTVARPPWLFGRTATTNAFCLSRDGGVAGYPLYKTMSGSGRYFAPLQNPNTTARSYVVQHTAGADSHSGTVRQDTADLTPGATVGTASLMALLDQTMEMGSAVAFANNYFLGKINSLLVFGAVLTDNDLTALDDELAVHAPPIPPTFLDAIPVTPTNAYSCCRKLRSAHSGSALRVRRSSDNTELSIGFVGDLVDTAALLAFVGAGSGFVATLYDQSGNGRDLIQTTLAWQPRIVNAGVLETYGSGRPTMVFDGTDDRLRRAVPGDSTGITGNPNITAGSVFQCSNVFSAVMWTFGGGGTTFGSMCSAFRTQTPALTIRKSHYGTERSFTMHTDISIPASYVLQHAADGDTHSGTFRQNGTLLALGSTTGTAIPLNLVDETMEIGTNSASGAVFLQGKLNCFVLYSAALFGADLTTLDAVLALHLEQGVVP